jgi:carboxylesterase
MSRWGRFLAAAMILIGGVWLALGPTRGGIVARASRPADTYDEAVRRIEGWVSPDDSLVNPICRGRVFGHGRKVDRAVVLFHGFTNCPRQFDALGIQLARLGYNVLIPRLPRHGLADRMTDALAGMTAAELAAAGEDALDIAHGLGDRVSVMGLSTSGVLAAWLAQNRPDIDRAMIIAPSLAPKGVPLNAARRLANALLVLPNFYVWWDSKRKADAPGPKNCYPRFASRAIAEAYRLGAITMDEAARSKPAARSMVILTTAHDEGVSNDAARALEWRWKSHGADARFFQIPDSLRIHHDMIDPLQPYQRVQVSYRIIIRLLTMGAAKPPDPSAKPPAPLQGAPR